MLKNLFLTAATAAAVSVPFAGVAWADQPSDPGGGCSANCDRGGLSGGTAQGPAQSGYTMATNTNPADPFYGAYYQVAGTAPVGASPVIAGHVAVGGTGVLGLDGSQSGNFTDPSNPRGHCTGAGCP